MRIARLLCAERCSPLYVRWLLIVACGIGIVAGTLSVSSTSPPLVYLLFVVVTGPGALWGAYYGATTGRDVLVVSMVGSCVQTAASLVTVVLCAWWSGRDLGVGGPGPGPEVAVVSALSLSALAGVTFGGVFHVVFKWSAEVLEERDG